MIVLCKSGSSSLREFRTYSYILIIVLSNC